MCPAHQKTGPDSTARCDHVVRGNLQLVSTVLKTPRAKCFCGTSRHDGLSVKSNIGRADMNIKKSGNSRRQVATETTDEPARREQTFQVLVDSITDYAIFTLDSQGRVANWNSGAERIKGYTRTEIIGEHFSRFYTEEDQLAGVPDQALATARNKGRFAQENWRVRKDGTRFGPTSSLMPFGMSTVGWSGLPK